MNILTLERELGVPLFDRLGRQVRLTAPGQRLLPHAQHISEILEAARATVTDTRPQGTLAIGAAESPGTYRLPPIIALLRTLYPDVHVSIRMGSCADHRQALREGHIDAAIMLDEPEEGPDLMALDLYPEPIHVVLAPNHPLASMPDLPLHELMDYPYLATEPGSYRARFEDYLAHHQFAPSRVTELGSVELIKQCIQAGLGFGILPTMTVKAEVAAGHLITRAWPEGEFTMATRLVRHRDRWVSPPLNVFWQTATEYYRRPSPQYRS